MRLPCCWGHRARTRAADSLYSSLYQPLCSTPVVLLVFMLMLLHHPVCTLMLHSRETRTDAMRVRRELLGMLCATY